MKEVGLVWRTVRHLTARQVAYQVLTRLRGRARLKLPTSAPFGHFLRGSLPDKPVSWISGTFTFLNQSAYMPVVDWNHGNHGKLWTYNLNYFDFLNQSTLGAFKSGAFTPDKSTASADPPDGMSVGTGLAFMRAFMAETGNLNDGLEPYPTSLRIVNWVHFLSRNQIQDGAINRHLYAQARLLRRRFEYHIAGNHLLENGFALLMAALYFRQENWFKRAVRLVRTELSAQLLTDGGHAERSPMYHQILLDRLLDVLLALRHDTWHSDPAITGFLVDRATQMLAWLGSITFRNGEVPMVNDAAPCIATTTARLRAKAFRAGLKGCLPEPESGGGEASSGSTQLRASGYRKFTFPRYELLTDVGAIGPDNQPGHAHADTLSFVLHVDNQPLIVDSGTSTYETGPRRAWERSTMAHNTVDPIGKNSSEVWAGFRVGQRAQTTVVTDMPNHLVAHHDGYRKWGIDHQRSWEVSPAHIRITDRLLKAKTSPQTGIARLYFHPDVPVKLVRMGAECGPVRITFASVPAPEVRLTTYKMADGFNRLRVASCVEITFANCLETVLILIL